MHDLTGCGVGLRVLAGEGAAIDTTTANGRLMFGFFAALAEFERELIVERTIAQRSVCEAAGPEAAGGADLASTRARGRNGGRPLKMTSAKLRLSRPPWASLVPTSRRAGRQPPDPLSTRHAGRRVAARWARRKAVVHG